MAVDDPIFSVADGPVLDIYRFVEAVVQIVVDVCTREDFAAL